MAALAGDFKASNQGTGDRIEGTGARIEGTGARIEENMGPGAGRQGEHHGVIDMHARMSLLHIS